MTIKKEKSREKFKVSLGKLVEAAKEVAEAEQAFYGRKPKSPQRPTILGAGRER